MSRRKVLLAWSSGKDSAWTLHVLRADPAVDVVALFTTVDETEDRVAMHAVRRQLLHAQARAAGLPLWAVPIPRPCSNTVYEAEMARVIARARTEGIDAIAFGDLFLEDVRRYREERMAESGVEPLFPLWGVPTTELAKQMLAAGLRAVISCVDTVRLDGRLVGRPWDEALLAELPPSCDPCGENGEFHTFVTAGPMLARAIEVRLGEMTRREQFAFVDLLAAEP